MLRGVWVKTCSFLQKPAFCVIWFLPVWLALGVAKILIFRVSFRKIAPRLGVLTGISPWIPLLEPWQVDRARKISETVHMAARCTPWESNCFPQAVVATRFLGLYRVPYALYFGLARDSDGTGFGAHAWLSAGPVKVTGGAGFSRYTVVGCFVSPVYFLDQNLGP